MKTTKLMLAVVLVPLLSLSRCQKEKEEVSLAQANLPTCNMDSRLDFLMTVKNEESTVEEYVINPNSGKGIVTYVVKCSQVPTGYLAFCNLPDEYKRVGIRLRFSANVYQPKNMAYINLNAVPAELTSVQNITPDN